MSDLPPREYWQYRCCGNGVVMMLVVLEMVVVVVVVAVLVVAGGVVSVMVGVGYSPPLAYCCSCCTCSHTSASPC